MKIFTIFTFLMFSQWVFAAEIQQSPLSVTNNGRLGSNQRIVTTGIRSPIAPSNHALIITVSAYPVKPLKGVQKDREIANELALRFGVPSENQWVLSESQVNREALQIKLGQLNQKLLPGDKLFVYFSGHGARFSNEKTGLCTEALVTHDLKLISNQEFMDMLKPLASKAGKLVMLVDSCHSGGIVQTASRDLGQGAEAPRPKFNADASATPCNKAVNVRGFSEFRGVEIENTDQNVVMLAAARSNEVAWDTDEGGAMTSGFLKCLRGDAVDSDNSGAISMQELSQCVQGKLDRMQSASTLQHLTLSGNGGLVPGFMSGSAIPEPIPTPAPPVKPSANSLAALKDIHAQRDDRLGVEVRLSKEVLRIGKDQLDFQIKSNFDGYVYVFYRGSREDSFYLLFPNQLDSSNMIKSGETLKIPRPSWTVNAMGPAGTDHLLVMVTESPRDFSSLSLPKEYVSAAGPFTKVKNDSAALSSVGQIAVLSNAIKQSVCGQSGLRDLSIAKSCSSAFGSAMVSVQETDQ